MEQKEAACSCCKHEDKEELEHESLNPTKAHHHEDKDCCCGIDHHHEEDDDCCCGMDHHHDEDGCCCCGMEHRDVQKKGLIHNPIARNLIILGISLAFLVMGYFPWHDIAVDKGMPGLLCFYYVNPSWIAIILCGYPIFKGAVMSLAKKKLKVSVLISVAMLSSIGLEIASLCGVNVHTGGHEHSYVFAAGEIAFLMSLGEWIEDLTVKKCKSGIERLVGLIPKEAFVKVGDTLEKRSLKDINIGDIVVCKSGEMVAVDGEIIKGNCSIDQSSVTGEYLPVDLSIGDKVYGGTMNVNGTIEIQVQKLLKDMTVAKMADLVKEAEGKKAPIAKTADKWASYIVPSLVVLSPLVGIIAYFGLHTSVVEAVIRAITVLIVFCPCSLALATPTAVAAGLGNGAKNGVLIKSGESLEEINRAKIVCFDKTGTLTSGKLSVTDIITKEDEKQLMQYVASLEKYSEHPLSQAIVQSAGDIKFLEAKDIVTMSGKGISGVVDGNKIEVLSYKSYSNELSNENLELSKKLMDQGKTVVCVIINNSYAGMIALSDTIRDGALETINNLKARGFKTVMLTGDHKINAEYVAAKLGIDEVFADLLPEDKMNVIKGLQKDGAKVCMLGDGINDAPSLKLADVSFVVGAMSSDIALDSADMAVLNDQIEKVDYTVGLGRRVMKTIKVNITFAMCINFVTLMLSLFGYLDPVTGAVMHNVTSILVVCSSALILITPKKYREKFQTRLQK